MQSELILQRELQQTGRRGTLNRSEFIGGPKEFEADAEKVSYTSGLSGLKIKLNHRSGGASPAYATESIGLVRFCANLLPSSPKISS